MVQFVPTTSRRPRGFTLLETALAIVIVGTGVMSMITLFTVCTKQNRAGAEMTTAMFLANNIQEAMADLPFNDPISGKSHFGKETGETLAYFNDVDDFNGYVASPPIDSTRTTLPELSQYTQSIQVQTVDPNKPSITAAGTDAVRVTVRILFADQPGTPPAEVYRTSWVRMRS